ncbi:class I SAM-dependent methyltransferase [Micromonospora sp. NPDC000442]|uniref:class I SAM-dependent methyltransferase n=1 Tax=Micromonospora sp. NPDC000442 TaxID=3364217 RepID=UPI0036897C48
MRVANAHQVMGWNGPEGAHWAEHHDRRGDLDDALLDRPFRMAETGPTDVVLDIGCGTGRTTRRAARQCARGWAAGIDLSAPMLDRARAEAVREGLTNARFHQGDAPVYPFPRGRHDVVISRYGLGAGVRLSGRLWVVAARWQ